MHKNTFGCWLFLTLSTDMYWYILRNKKVHTEKKFKRNTNDWSENEISLERIITPKYWFLVIGTIFFRFFRSSFLPIKTVFWLLHEVKSFANYLKKKKTKKAIHQRQQEQPKNAKYKPFSTRLLVLFLFISCFFPSFSLHRSIHFHSNIFLNYTIDNFGVEKQACVCRYSVYCAHVYI